MKAIFSVALATIFGAHLLMGAGMTQRDREHLVAHLQMTEKWFLDEVSPLSATQWNFRTAPDRWTIAEVVQHLVIAEPSYWKQFQDGVKQPAQKLDKQATDADVLWYGIDRTRHEKTEPSKDAKGQTLDVRQGLETFQRLHAMMLEYARNTDDDLRAHAVPEWGVDAYQCLLEISTHTQRHILQIREIKADSRFPKQ